MLKLAPRHLITALAATLACGPLLARGPFALAADCPWTGQADNAWANAANWTDQKIPGASDTALFGDAPHRDIALDNDATISGIAFTSAAVAPFTISGHLITLSSDGTIIKSATPHVLVQTIASDIQIGDRATFKSQDTAFDNFNNMLVLKGQLHGSGLVTIEGTNGTNGGVDLAADNSQTFTGSVKVTSGLLLLQSTGALGSGKTPITLAGGTFMCFGGVHTDNAFHITGKVAWESSGGNSHGGAIAIDPHAVWTIGNGGGNPLTLSGAISGSGAIRMICGNTSFEGAESNTFSGTLNFSADSETPAYDELRLNKSAGAIAIASRLQLHGKANVIWQADDQIAPTTPIRLDGGKLSFDGHSNKLGVLTLTGPAEIDLGGGKSNVHFAASSAAKWTAKGQLLIHGWGNDQNAHIYFGDSLGALTAAQVAKIGFDSPTGKPTGVYRARISSEGELTPTDTATVPVNPPFDISSTADKQREKLYSMDGLAELTGAGTPLKAGERISIFGDSITWLNSYITDMRDALSASDTTKGLDVQIFNHGINGGGVLQVRDGSPTASYNSKDNNGPQAAFADVIASDKPQVAVVFIGINDVWWRKTSPEDFEKAMRDIAASAKAAHVKLVLATMAVHGEKPDGSNADDKKIAAFCAITRDVAKSTGATLVDLRAAYIAYLQNHNRQMQLDGSLSFRPSGVLTYDGVHPTAKGATFLANLISDGIYRAGRGSADESAAQ